ncbi:hypothetical protein E2320_000552 [Naja naja]|nr:hypothetical protein E2320_000552 [Naja naja]
MIFLHRYTIHPLTGLASFSTQIPVGQLSFHRLLSRRSPRRTQALCKITKLEARHAEGTSCALPRTHALLSPTSVSKKHGKLIGFLRTFMKSRPSKQRLKQRGILRERVFGCDLGEHLKNSGSDVPQVLRSCSDFIEKHGVVDGIYRLSGVSSNIQRLRHEFDSERVPELSKDVYLQDIHSVSSLCKLYFRELPNPLLTYQLYNKFADAVSVSGNEERLVRVHDVIQQLPPPHYRTLEFLLRHLARMAMHSQNTSMHIRNLAIVWAPNLLRSMALESVAQCGANAFQEVRVQSLVVEFLLTNVQGVASFLDPNPSWSAVLPPACYLSKKPKHVPRPSARSPSWKPDTFFAIGKAPVPFRKKSHRLGELFGLGESLPGSRGETVTLRSAKSEESLTSQASLTGLPKLPSLRRPHSSSDAFPTLKQCHSCSSLGSSVSGHGEGLATGADDAASRRRSSWLEGDSELDSELELSPPGLRGLDFDPLTYQCSPPVPQPSLSDDSSSASPVAALSPCSHPNVSQDASETSVSLPDKVLEMFSGGESRGLSSAPHMISMLLNMAGGQLSNTCEREVRGKICQAQDRLSPPKSRQAALQQKRQASLKQREPRTHFRRSLSLECKAADWRRQALYSMVRPSPKVPGLSPLQAQVRGRSIGSQSRNLKGGSQVPLSQSSPLGSSDCFSPYRRVLAELDQRDPQALPFSEPYHLSSLSPAYGLHPPPPPLSVPYPAFRQPQDAFPSSSPSAAPPKPPPPPHFPIMTSHLPLKTRSSTFQPCLTDHPLQPHSHFPASSRPGVNGSPPSQLEHENLYYEIVGEPPAYPGLARPWPSCPPLSTWPLSMPPTGSLRGPGARPISLRLPPLFSPS